MVPFELIA